MSEFRLPNSIQSPTATVVRWLKKPGESFAVGEGLVELELEAALAVVEAAEAGALSEILAKPGQTIAAGGVLARFVAAGEKASAAAAPTAKTATEKAVSHDQATGGKVVPVLMPQAGNTMEEGT